MFKFLTVCLLLGSCLAEENWQKTDFIWNFGIISQCQIGSPPHPINYFEKEPHFDPKTYSRIQKGDLVWVKCRFIPLFVKNVLPKVNHPFVLIIADGDESFPSNCKNLFNVEELLNHHKILHVFAQNCDYTGKSKKISHLPLGIDFHSIAYKNKNDSWGERGSPIEQERILKQILGELKPTSKRKKRAFVDFQHSDTIRNGNQGRFLQFREDRTTIFQRLLKTGLIDHGEKMRRSTLWQKKGEYAFSISPHGNGLDCHRMWEDLVLGCIVIVKTSPLDPLYKGLPL